MKLKNKVAIITGSSGYIGSTTAKKLASEGAIVIVSDLNIKSCRSVADEIIATGGEAVPTQMDVRSIKSIENAVNQIIKRFNKIDILVNVAGGSARKRASTVADSNPEVINEILDVNLRGVIFCARAVISHMIQHKSGKIVSVASAVATQGQRRHADYSAAKAGVIAFSKSLAMEAAPHNINVNCVSPGLVPRPNENKDTIPKTNYLGKVAKPESVANLILFLVSDQADFVVGQNYIVDGGWSLGLKGRH
jgi:3-oxoacyl-[acyl-carrier protein] reductase